MSNIYRLEVSNVPYVANVDFYELLESIVRAIAENYEIVNINGKEVCSLLENRTIVVNILNNITISPNSYIDFIANQEDCEKLVKEYDTFFTLLASYLCINDNHILTSQVGAINIVYEYLFSNHNEFKYMREGYHEFYYPANINTETAGILAGYAYDELDIKNKVIVEQVHELETLSNFQISGAPDPFLDITHDNSFNLIISVRADRNSAEAYRSHVSSLLFNTLSISNYIDSDFISVSNDINNSITLNNSEDLSISFPNIRIPYLDSIDDHSRIPRRFLN